MWDATANSSYSVSFDASDFGDGLLVYDGGAMADDVAGGVGADTILGNSGNDTIEGNAGADCLAAALATTGSCSIPAMWPRARRWTAAPARTPWRWPRTRTSPRAT